jgi:hypothetical protein
MARSCDAKLRAARRAGASAAAAVPARAAASPGGGATATRLANAPLRFTLSVASAYGSSGGRMARVYSSMAASNCGEGHT